MRHHFLQFLRSNEAIYGFYALVLFVSIKRKMKVRTHVISALWPERLYRTHTASVACCGGPIASMQRKIQWCRSRFSCVACVVSHTYIKEAHELKITSNTGKYMEV